MEFGIHQQVFMLFFAIFWGASANVQPRWKAFQFPLMFVRELRWNVCRRVCLAIVLLNLLPILYFGYVLYFTSLPGVGPVYCDSNFVKILKVILHGVVPALGMFGIYRLWISIIELKPDLFYKQRPVDIPDKYRHIEPTYRLNYKECRKASEPVVDLGSDAWKGNCVAALIYLIIGLISPWL